MRAPIDDERVRRWIVEIRALAFALLAHGFWWIMTPEYARARQATQGMIFALAGVLATGALARWAERRSERPIWLDVTPARAAGLLAMPAVWLVVGVARAIGGGSSERFRVSW